MEGKGPKGSPPTPLTLVKYVSKLTEDHHTISSYFVRSNFCVLHWFLFKKHLIPMEKFHQITLENVHKNMHVDKKKYVWTMDTSL